MIRCRVTEEQINNMNRQEIITELKKYFDIKELVCNHIYDKFGTQAWMFLSTPLLHTLLVLRTEIVNVPMVVNTSSLKQRGMRCNMCPIVKGKTSAYISAHVTGNGVDFSCNGISAEDIRKLIKANQDKLPYNIRLEDDVNWVHIDVYDYGFLNKITMFKV